MMLEPIDFQEFIQRLYEQMLEDTRQDISTNILSRIRSVVSSAEQIRMSQDDITLYPNCTFAIDQDTRIRLQTEIAGELNKRGLKLPWTSIENRFSIIYLYARFKYQAGKLGLSSQASHIERLIAQFTFDPKESRVLEMVKNVPKELQNPSWVRIHPYPQCEKSLQITQMSRSRSTTEDDLPIQ